MVGFYGKSFSDALRGQVRLFDNICCFHRREISSNGRKRIKKCIANTTYFLPKLTLGTLTDTHIPHMRSHIRRQTHTYTSTSHRHTQTQTWHRRKQPHTFPGQYLPHQEQSLDTYRHRYHPSHTHRQGSEPCMQEGYPGWLTLQFLNWIHMWISLMLSEKKRTHTHTPHTTYTPHRTTSYHTPHLIPHHTHHIHTTPHHTHIHDTSHAPHHTTHHILTHHTHHTTHHTPHTRHITRTTPHHTPHTRHITRTTPHTHTTPHYSRTRPHTTDTHRTTPNTTPHIPRTTLCCGSGCVVMFMVSLRK
jgi:hypothetical protein